MNVYLDNSATTIIHEDIVKVYEELSYVNYGNPSSIHSMGVQSEKMIKEARSNVARLLKTQEKEIVFTSGGTEANNLALIGATRASRIKKGTIITTPIEHPSVLNTVKYLESEGHRILYVKLKNNGLVDLDDLSNILTDDISLVSIMAVNNETGVIQNSSAIGSLIKKGAPKALFHVDAVQAFGKVDISVNAQKIDLLSISSHKIHGPKGAGALYIRKGVRVLPLFYGGNQENGIRPGTENVPAIVGFGEACLPREQTLKSKKENITSLKNYFVNKIIDTIPSAELNGELSDDFSPYIANISFHGIGGEIIVHSLERKNIYVSTGSACSSKNKKFSHVLQALNIDEERMKGAVRFSFSEYTTKEQLDYVIDQLIITIEELEKIIKRK